MGGLAMPEDDDYRLLSARQATLRLRVETMLASARTTCARSGRTRSATSLTIAQTARLLNDTRGRIRQ
jgi:hypothetical protein